MPLNCGVIFDQNFIANLLLHPIVKEFGKSATSVEVMEESVLFC